MRLFALAAAMCAACSTSPDVVAIRTGDAGAVDLASAAICAGSGPVVRVGDGVGPGLCGASAGPVFRYALCTCAGLSAASGVVTDAFDSREGAFVRGEPGGSVGVNGDLAASDALRVGGSLRVAGRSTLAPGVALEVRDAFRAGGSVDAGGPVVVGTEVRAAANVQVEVLETPALVADPAATLSLGPSSRVAQTFRAEVNGVLPCACDASGFFDVSARVAAALASEDVAAQPVAFEALSNLEAPRTAALPCGAHAFSRISGAGLTLELSGRTAVFVAGDLALEGGLEVRLLGAGELDLFVAGNVVGQARFLLGDAASAGRVRLYVGGAGTVNLGGGGRLAGSLYAPRAELVSPLDLEVFGSLFVRRLAASGLVTVHYDLAAEAGGCEGAVDPCVGGGDCAAGACVDGLCVPCASDAACEAPRRCEREACVFPEP